MPQKKNKKYKRYVELAAMLVYETCHGKYRRNGIPAFTHPAIVAWNVLQVYQDYRLQTIAYLHDILEDSNTSETKLRQLFPQDVVDVVVILTHKKEDTYLCYINKVLQNKDAVKIKYEDILMNLNDSPTKRQKKKYEIALQTITYFNLKDIKTKDKNHD